MSLSAMGFYTPTDTFSAAVVSSYVLSGDSTGLSHNTADLRIFADGARKVIDFSLQVSSANGQTISHAADSALVLLSRSDHRKRTQDAEWS